MGRMSELLDRFRPAGAPGASSVAGAPDVAVDGAEFTVLLEELQHIETAAAALVEAGRVRADEVRAGATERAQAIAATTPESCAAAAAETRVQRQAVLASSLAELDSAAEAEIARIRSTAAERQGAIVTKVLDGVLGAAQLHSQPVRAESQS